MSDMNDPFEVIVQSLEGYAQAEQNVLLMGERGVGKTSIALDIARKLDLRLAYFSAPTLDPWADLIGVPVPENGSLHFVRPANIMEAEWIFLDELNRAHPRIQNAVLELTLFKTLNGQPVERLKMVWAAINPPDGDYQVFDLAPALIDRFHFHVSLPCCPSSNYFFQKFPESVARPLLEWWHHDLSDVQRKAITPRRLDFIGSAHLKNLPLEHCVPFGVTVPIHLLIQALNSGDHIRAEDILREPLRFKNTVKEDINFAWRFLHLLDTFKHEELYTVRLLILELPPEILMSLRRQHNNTYQKLFKAIRIREKQDRVLEYEQKIARLIHAKP